MPSRRDIPQNGYFEHASIPEREGRPDPEVSGQVVDVSLDGQYLCYICVKLRARILEIWTTRDTTDVGSHALSRTLTEGYLNGCTLCALILGQSLQRPPPKADAGRPPPMAADVDAVDAPRG